MPEREVPDHDTERCEDCPECELDVVRVDRTSQACHTHTQVHICSRIDHLVPREAGVEDLSHWLLLFKHIICNALVVPVCILASALASS